MREASFKPDSAQVKARQREEAKAAPDGLLPSYSSKDLIDP